MATREEKMEAFGQLLDILDELRAVSYTHLTLPTTSRV